MNLKSLITGIIFFILAHTVTWFQVNGQFIWNSFKENTFLLTLFGIPISYFYIWAAKYTVGGFNNTMWPARFVGFGIGILIYALLVGIFFKEGISLKTLTSLLLAISLILVQVFWK
jgi:hypothetical protein